MPVYLCPTTRHNSAQRHPKEEVMYYSNGNYEAFARPKKPEGIDSKNAVHHRHGTCGAVRGLLSGARRADARQPHPRLRKGRGCRAAPAMAPNIPGVGYVMRGGREMDNHFEVMWDLFRSIPSIETEGVSVLGRVLLAQQGGSQLFAMPLHQGAWRGRAARTASSRCPTRPRWRS